MALKVPQGKAFSPSALQYDHSPPDKGRQSNSFALILTGGGKGKSKNNFSIVQSSVESHNLSMMAHAKDSLIEIDDN